MERRVSVENIIINGLSPGSDYTIFVQSHYKTETKHYPGTISRTQTHCSIPLSGMLTCFLLPLVQLEQLVLEP